MSISSCWSGIEKIVSLIRCEAVHSDVGARRIHGIEVEHLGDSTWQFTYAGSDFHVRKEGARWRLDEFDSSIRDADEAWRFSDDFPTLRAAVGFAVGADMP